MEIIMELGRGRSWYRVLLNVDGYRFLFGMMKNFWKWTVVMVAQPCIMPLNYTLKNVKMVNFILYIFYHN